MDILGVSIPTVAATLVIWAFFEVALRKAIVGAWQSTPWGKPRESPAEESLRARDVQDAARRTD